MLGSRLHVASVLAIWGINVESLNGPKVHSLFNVMTMEANVEEFFGRLEIGFEATVSVT